mgnify:CR=1 FL=1|jgi:transposase
MNKSTFFTGQPIFSQLIKLIPRSIISQACSSHQSDRYCKKFDTYHHLITMLYCCYQHCTSLREVVSGLGACEGRLQPLGITHLPARSTLSEANIRRSYKTFEQIYYSLYRRYRGFLPDSRSDKLSRRLVIIDSTTISLFQEILKAAGTRGLNGKKKGGIKVHTAIRAHEDVPFLVRFSSAASADVSFLKHVHLPKGSIVVMDRGYNSYKKLHEWSLSGVDWVTRLRADSKYEVTGEQIVTEEQKALGVRSDQHIKLGFKNNVIQQVDGRIVRYYDQENKREFAFITNNRTWDPYQVAEIYKKRWQIELLFKRLKQNMPLNYFLGDNENAIKIQIYCALIADLILKMATNGIKRKWAFSNLASIVRLHLMNYASLRKFLEQPDKCRVLNPVPDLSPQLKLNLSG